MGRITQVPASIQVHAPLNNGMSLAELLFGRVLNTKMPELTGLDDEEANISDQGVTQKKQANKDYIDKHRETWFCWNRENKTSYRHRMRRSHMR